MVEKELLELRERVLTTLTPYKDNQSRLERLALKNVKSGTDIVIREADNEGAVVSSLKTIKQEL